MRLISAFLFTLLLLPATGVPAHAQVEHPSVWWLIQDDAVLYPRLQAVAKVKGAIESDGTVPADRAIWDRLAAACGLPLGPRVEGFSDIESWRATPCLASTLREMAQEAGLPVERLPVAESADGLHPLCVDALRRAETGTPQPLGLCQAAIAHIPVERSGDWVLARRVLEGMRGGYFGYRFAGRDADGIGYFETVDNGGGTGNFSTLLWVAGLAGDPPRVAGGVAAMGDLPFGDRCNGGLSAAAIVGPGILDVAYNITSWDLFALADSAESALEDGPATPPWGYEDLESSAAGCIGSARYRIDLGRGTKAFLGVTLDSVPVDRRDYSAMQACFNDLLILRIDAPPARFDAESYGRLKGDFLARCVTSDG